MATTTDAKTLSYSENDKLGPLGTKVSALYDPTALRTMLLREFDTAVQAAKKAAGSVDQGATAAVHDARKALRRARAVISMVAEALPKSERRAVLRALQEARRALSAVRDHAVAPETLAQLTLGDDDRATARRVLENAAQALPAVAEIKQLLAESASRAAAQGEALAAALPQEIGWDVVAAGIRSVYGQARRARRAGKRSKSWFHTWRRRSKEITYQLELVANQAGPRLTAVHSEVDGVTNTLSPAVDLIMLREFVSTYDQGIAPEAIDQLTRAIDAQLVDLMKDARKAGRDAFGAKPGRFEKRLTKAVKRDLTPVEDGDTNGDLAAD
jgi:CHAD domain-containing protein